MKQLFNDNWCFCKFPLEVSLEQIFSTGEWTPVDLPHDWMIYDTTNLYEAVIKKLLRENPSEAVLKKYGLFSKASTWTRPYI